VGSVELPSEPEEPGRIDRADAGGADRPAPKPREMPEPGERGRVYEAMRAHVEAGAAEEAGPGRRIDGVDQRSYWDEVPRFLEIWADHEQRLPAHRQPAADRSDDLPGSYRSHGGSYLRPERHAETGEAMGRVREAEPRVSADVRATERENTYGGWLEGFEFRLKGEDRLKEKVAEQLEAEPDKSSAEILRKVPDAIRYTFCFQPENYARGYYDIKERLESRGYEMYYSKNSWADPEYKGINTRWVAPDGQRFEVQFHTPESFHAKHHVTHAAYERIRNPATNRQELREWHAFQRDVSSRIPVPDGAAGIPDFKKEGF
jgi:hypothetical protein